MTNLCIFVFFCLREHIRTMVCTSQGVRCLPWVFGVLQEYWTSRKVAESRSRLKTIVSASYSPHPAPDAYEKEGLQQSDGVQDNPKPEELAEPN